MKNPQIIFLLLILLPFSAAGQGNQQFYRELSEAMGSGNTDRLGQLFHEEVDISENGKEGSYNREQAGNLLHNFFQENRPANFHLKHKGASADGQVYIIGQLETRTGQHFKIVCRAKSWSGGYRIFKLDVMNSF